MRRRTALFPSPCAGRWDVAPASSAPPCRSPRCARILRGSEISALPCRSRQNFPHSRALSAARRVRRSRHQAVAALLFTLSRSTHDEKRRGNTPASKQLLLTADLPRVDFRRSGGAAPRVTLPWSADGYAAATSFHSASC